MWISMKLAPSPDPQMAAQQRQMSIMMTGMMVWWFIQTRWSSAFLLYYLVQNILSTWQQYVYIYKPNKLKGSGCVGNVSDILVQSLVRILHRRSARPNRRPVCGMSPSRIRRRAKLELSRSKARLSRRPIARAPSVKHADKGKGSGFRGREKLLSHGIVP